ncbi:MAG: ribbon-helix-helix protein, CopG family [Planctomycetia bacterium]|nr:ribbon-helix-helix protein, CopG family [Planctomycetia bacterium]
MKPLSIRVPRSLRAALEKLAREKREPVTSIVRQALRSYIAVQRFRALRRKTLRFAEAQGFLTDEDVFRAVS